MPRLQDHGGAFSHCSARFYESRPVSPIDGALPGHKYFASTDRDVKKDAHPPPSGEKNILSKAISLGWMVESKKLASMLKLTEFEWRMKGLAQPGDTGIL